MSLFYYRVKTVIKSKSFIRKITSILYFNIEQNQKPVISLVMFFL